MEMIREEAYPKAGPVPEITITSLLGKVASYDPEADEELIPRPYSTPHAAHKDQVRKSGEPFVYHPLATADILADLRMDSTTIAAAILHDVLEDTDLTKEELETRFGEDLAFATLHPRRYEEIKRLVAARRADRESFINATARELLRHLEEAGIEAEVKGRVKHFYSIYNKMVQRNKEFNEIYDLTGLRVIVDDVRDCYGTLGVIHSLWKPIPGRFKDYVAMPKFNMYQSLHTTVMSNEGKLLEIQLRTREMDTIAEYGVAAHWMYKRGLKDSQVDRLAWLKSVMEWQGETTDAAEFMESLKDELVADEVYVFTPKGDVVSLPSGATPIDFAYHVHTEVGHRTVGARVNDRIVPLDSELVSGDRVEVITGKSPKPSRDWLAVVQSGRARNKIRQFFNKADWEDNLSLGREKVASLLKKQRVERDKVPADVWKEVAASVNYSTAEDMLA